MNKPVFDLILGCIPMKELVIVLDFWTKEIALDMISHPMRDIKDLRTRAVAAEALSMNNSTYQSMFKEPHSTLEATKCLIEILDSKYEKANLRAITKEECLNHFSATEKDKLLKLLQEF